MKLRGVFFFVWDLQFDLDFDLQPVTGEGERKKIRGKGNLKNISCLLEIGLLVTEIVNGQ